MVIRSGVALPQANMNEYACSHMKQHVVKVLTESLLSVHLDVGCRVGARVGLHWDHVPVELEDLD